MRRCRGWPGTRCPCGCATRHTLTPLRAAPALRRARLMRWRLRGGEPSATFGPQHRRTLRTQCHVRPRWAGPCRAWPAILVLCRARKPNPRRRACLAALALLNGWRSWCGPAACAVAECPTTASQGPCTTALASSSSPSSRSAARPSRGLAGTPWREGRARSGREHPRHSPHRRRNCAAAAAARSTRRACAPSSARHRGRWPLRHPGIERPCPACSGHCTAGTTAAVTGLPPAHGFPG